MSPTKRLDDFFVWLESGTADDGEVDFSDLSECWKNHLAEWHRVCSALVAAYQARAEQQRHRVARQTELAAEEAATRDRLMTREMMLVEPQP